MKDKLKYRDFSEWLADQQAWEKTWTGFFMMNLYYPLRLFLLDNFWYFRWYHQGLKAFWQRGRRGWADCDTWCLDYYLAEVLAGSLAHLKASKHGISSSFLPSGEPEEFEWRVAEELQEQNFSRWIEAFKVYAEGRDEEADYLEVQFCLRSMANHYRSLWD